MRLWPRTLRGRLVGAAALAVLASLVLFGLGATIVVERQLRDGVDGELRRRAADVAQIAAVTPALLDAPGTLDVGSGGRQIWVEVRDARQRIVARSASLGGRLLPGSSALDGALRQRRAAYADGSLDEEPLRLYAAPLTEAGRAASGGAVLVASSVEDIEATFGQLRRLMWLVALAAAAVGALLVTGLTARALLPLRRLAGGARSISESPEPGRRLPAEAADDEIGELTTSLNRMLDALNNARAAERRLLADASHELRTPITALRGNAAFARRYGADEELLVDLEADSERLARLVDDLLALEREQGAEPPAGEVALADLVATVTADDPQITVVDAAPVIVRGRSDALERALRNLVENARVHGPPDGAIRVALTRDGEHAVLAVSDDGPGIPPDRAKLAVRRFWRGPQATSERRPGSGLGLAIVAATAEGHGGRLWIERSTIALVIPAVRKLSRAAHTVGSR